MATSPWSLASIADLTQFDHTITIKAGDYSGNGTFSGTVLPGATASGAAGDPFVRTLMV